MSNPLIDKGRADYVGIDKHSETLCSPGSCVCGKEAAEQQQIERELMRQAHDDGMAWDRETIRPEDWGGV